MPFPEAAEVAGRADAFATVHAADRNDARDTVTSKAAERIILHALGEGSTAGIDDGAALRHQIVQSTQRELLTNGLLGR